MANTTENPNEETIKCVIVGDNNVGKTRLICARAHNEQGPNSRILSHTSHVPTVWAIDQYRINKEVLQNARCTIDGTAVSLRLWDTFGDHHKNRKFAYGKADVVIVCFSICDEKSLRHVRQFWYPEVRKHCKNIPIILVGCKADLRFADLVKLNKSKGCLSRVIRDSDILYPDKCRAVAVEQSCPYYETSVLLAYGVHELFENVCRAALIYRKTLSFWNSKLKRVVRPSLQKPLEPPKPDPPLKNDHSSLFLPNLIELYQHELLADVIFLCKDRKISAHKTILGASSNVFFQLFTSEDCYEETNDVDLKLTSTNNYCTCSRSKLKSDSVILNLKELNLEESIPEKQECDSKDLVCQNCRRTSNFPVNYCGKNNQGISLYSFNLPFHIARLLVEFCYSGTISSCDNSVKLSADALSVLLDAAERLCISHLYSSISAILKGEIEFVVDLTQQFLNHRSQNIRKLFVEQKHFSDVVFQVDDGFVHGHKVLLSSGCDMMNAMFAGSFVESENKQVLLPYTTANCLELAFKYVYLNETDFDGEGEDLCELITLANRLCLQGLISHLENQVMKRFERREATYSKTTEVAIIKLLCEEAVLLLRTAQVHNAPVLQQWCLYFLSVHYNESCRHAAKFMKHLPPDTLRSLEEHRWPPVWYIKQRDHYDRAVLERIEAENKKVKRY